MNKIDDEQGENDEYEDEDVESVTDDDEEEEEDYPKLQDLERESIGCC